MSYYAGDFNFGARQSEFRRDAVFAEALAQRGGGPLLAKLVSDCLSISPTHSDGWLAAALHWKQDLARMSELLEKVTASDPQCVHAHLLEAELHLERRQYAAALFSARNAHALHRSVRSYRCARRGSCVAFARDAAAVRW